MDVFPIQENETLEFFKKKRGSSMFLQNERNFNTKQFFSN